MQIDPAHPYTLRARWVLPIEGQPIAGGAVTIRAGKIIAVESRPSRKVDADFPNAAILPGFVNAHTHLEFSDLAAPLGTPGMRFPDWIRLVVSRRRTRLASLSSVERSTQRLMAIEGGLRESLAASTTLLGEIASESWPWPCTPPAAACLAGVIFHESIGFKSEASAAELQSARRELEKPAPASSWSHGLSPHAPYTVHPELLREVIAISREQHIPLAMHLAESPEELELLAAQTGPFRELLEAFGAWQEAVLRRGGTPLDYLKLLAEADSALVIHGNYLSTEERQLLADHRGRLTLVYCPRTHAYFRHKPYPLADLLREGVSLALGTDSRASNPDLSMLAELKFALRTHPQVSPSEILRLGTLAGAEALRQGELTGSLVPGKRADLAIVAIDPAAPDPAEAILAEPSRVIAAIANGRSVWQEDVTH